MEQASTDTIGIDIGDRTSHYCVLSASGERIQVGTFRTERDVVDAFFRERAKSRIAMEVGTHSPWMYRLAAAAGHEVLVVNARKLKLLTENERKRDRKDAELLARIARSSPDLLSLVQHRTEASQRHLHLLRTRDLLVRKRTSCVTEIRGMAKSLGIRIRNCDSSAFTKAARATLPDCDLLAAEPVLAIIDALSAQISNIEKNIEQLAKTEYREAFELVSQPQGIGVITGLAFLLIIERPERFKKSRDVAAYLGLVPRSDQSGNTDKQLGISKSGDALLRRLLVQCALYILHKDKNDSDLKRWATTLAARGGKSGRKRAAIALARKLAVVMHRLWTTGEVYQPLGHAEAA